MTYSRNYQNGGFVSQRDAYLEIDRIAKENDFNPLDLHTMAMMESSYGTGKDLGEGSYQGFFQFGEDTAKDYNVKDRLNVGQSAKGAIDLVRDRTKKFGKRTRNLIDEYEISDPGLLGYLTHQQGRSGFLDILSTAKSGNFSEGQEKTRRDSIWKNLSEAEKELVLGNDADKYREGETYALPSTGDVPNATLAKNYLGFTNQRWSAKKEETEGLIGGFNPSDVAPGMAGGGDVRGQNTDTVPAMLTPGEFVIRKDAADQIGPEKLQMLNNVDRLGDMALLENAKSPMGYQKGGLVGMLGDFIKGQKENWARAKTTGEETGVRNPFLRTADEQLAQMQGAGTMPRGGWLEKKMPQAYGAGNPELKGPSKKEYEVESLREQPFMGVAATAEPKPEPEERKYSHDDQMKFKEHIRGMLGTDDVYEAMEGKYGVDIL